MSMHPDNKAQLTPHTPDPYSTSAGQIALDLLVLFGLPAVTVVLLCCMVILFTDVSAGDRLQTIIVVAAVALRILANMRRQRWKRGAGGQ